MQPRPTTDERRIITTCARLERERGTLNYNKAAWIGGFKAALQMEWVEDEV
jgi:hypothetical protein